jgi:hypothetical protein
VAKRHPRESIGVHTLTAFGFWLLAFGFWLLAFGFWLLAFGFWLLAFGFWLNFNFFERITRKKAKCKK